MEREKRLEFGAQLPNELTNAPSLLLPHPGFRSPPIEIAAAARWLSLETLALSFAVHGPIEAVRWPARTPPKRRDGLWRRTCFEAFLKAPHSSKYVELNISPSSEWAAYCFTGRREGMATDAYARLAAFSATRAADSFALEASFAFSPGAPILASSRQSLSLAAVIAETGGASTYWALAHRSESPDFHHPASFVGDLQRPKSV